ncbi:Mediator of RNA polymerase II transcription subunit 15 [Trinorchestia longiramus]|nr:Mediator of RNA polymerase II transcription subunit 15 [Trinorchestia longiramus]
MAEDFKSQAFRSRNVQQIAELLRATSTPPAKNAGDIENQVFACCKNKTEYQAKMSRVLSHLKDQVPPSSQSHPHLAAMLTGQPPPSLQGQMNQANQQMSPMSGQMGQQLGGGQGQVGQMGQQIGQVGQMGNSMSQGNPQMGQGQMVSHVSQGMGPMSGLGQPMGMGGVSVSHAQGLGMSGQGNQMGVAGGQGGQMNVGGTQGGQMNLGQGGQMNMAAVQGGQMTMNRMGPGNQVLNQMTMVGQTASGMGGGQVLTNTNPGMMGPGQGLVASRMATGIGMGGLGSDMSWQSSNSHMAMAGIKGNMAGAMASKMRPMQPMQIGGQAVTAQMGGMGIGRAVSVTGSNATMQPRIPSPSYSGAPGGGMPRQNIPNSPASNMTQNNQQQPNQMMSNQQPSPAFISPSPSATMIPSPVGSGGRSGMMGAPSPSSSMVNTPGQPMQPSPVSAPQGEDKAYLEKVQQLQKYVDPLKNVIANCGREEGKSSEINKMKKLLDLLTNPTRRIPTETLEKCEKVLQKVLEKNDGESQAVHKESAVEVLMDGVRAALKAPNSATIFHRTIAPAVEKLTGCSIPLPPSPKRRKVEESNDETSPKISYVIQGEIARLSPRFKVNLDSNQPACSDDLSLTCHLDDTNLPCVPPLTLTIPEKYPELPSVATLSHLEYSSTDFLKLVQNLFLRRQKHLPLSTSITMLLDTWEMSIRQACSPNAAKNPDAVSPITAIMQLMSESS